MIINSTQIRPTSESFFSKEKKEDSGFSKSTELTEAEEKEVRELKKIDREVKAHEQAHLAAAGDLARGGATYTFTSGPDERRYATSGGVDIDIFPVKGNPKETIKKMQKVKRAALAPADPSPQDRSVAATAAREIAKAQAELNSQAGKS
jgi:hypothetical protein